MKKHAPKTNQSATKARARRQSVDPTLVALKYVKKKLWPPLGSGDTPDAIDGARGLYRAVRELWLQSQATHPGFPSLETNPEIQGTDTHPKIRVTVTPLIRCALCFAEGAPQEKEKRPKYWHSIQTSTGEIFVCTREHRKLEPTYPRKKIVSKKGRYR